MQELMCARQLRPHWMQVLSGVGVVDDIGRLYSDMHTYLAGVHTSLLELINIVHVHNLLCTCA